MCTTFHHLRRVKILKNIAQTLTSSEKKILKLFPGVPENSQESGDINDVGTCIYI